MAFIKLPGLIDVHVHLRDPGQTNKEDFFTGTRAALFGGFTTVLDMPNNKLPITTYERLNEKIKTAKNKTVCDIGFYFGSLGNNINEFEYINNDIFGLKLFLNQTTGNYLINEKELLRIYENWIYDKPILIHGEESTLDKVIKIVKKTGKKTHICHISSQYELQKIIEAKYNNLPITCGITPHHLFLTEDEIKKLNNFGLVKPPIKKPADKEFLWKKINYIDIIESDHAPHTKAEKQSSTPIFGMPGLETTLPLLLSSCVKGILKIDDIVRLCFQNPAKIFNIPTYTNTYIEIDGKEKYLISNNKMKTKCGWTPFDGWQVIGKVKKVVIRDKKVMENDQLLVRPGFGKIIKPMNNFN